MTRYKVQKRISLKGGRNIGQVWKTVVEGKRRAVAESIALRVRIDHDDAVRIVQQ